MECGLCGTLNRELARFCGGCGAPLGRVCPNCKSEIDAGLRFCDQCGTEVDATPVATAPAPPVASGSAPDAVRKTVTVLFADLGGSTGFGERTDPEIARQVLARYHAMLQQAIDAHGGTVAKFMGDGMMATFGIPEVAEDDAERAVRAGIEIQDRFARFAADIATRYGETLTARVGVNTGEIVIGAADADFVGDALNVAARLEKACRPGHVLVGEETWRATRGVVVYEPLGEVKVSGREQPVGTYEVSSVERRAAEPVAPFVGRESELARLRVAFDRAVAERSAVLVTVLGSPGLGKTRLSREFLAALAATGAAATFEIRCDRAGTATFAPVADLVRMAADLGDSETEESARERLTTLLDGIEDVDRVVDGLLGVLGVAPLRSVEETFWSVRRGVAALAAVRPLVVVIDDIQWAEPKLLDLAEHLQEWVTDAPVLLVGLARPELRELRPTFVEPGRRVADVLALDGLDARATEELAARLLGSALPRELVARLPVSTDGNPLFVRELVRMLVDDRVLVRRDDGGWDLAIDVEAIEVPPTIQSLLSTRVERLPAEELRLLECASVVGAEFSVGALRELVGDGPDIATLLERMRRRELVEPTGSYWGDDPVHRFHHVLIRDAAYRRLLKGARAELHRQVGEWTDAAAIGATGEHEIAVGFHFEQAHRYRTELGLDDDETEHLGARAAGLLAAAAHRALEGDDLAAAGALARRALAVLPVADREARAGLLLTACESLLASGDVVGGAPLVEELARSAGSDPQLAAWADCFRAQLVGLTEPEGLVESEALAAQAATTFDALGAGAGEAKAHQVRALLLARLGRVGEAEAVLDLALGAARAADDRRRVTAVLGAAPQAALFGPSPVARAGGRCLDVVRLLRITTASPSVEATSMRCQAVLEALRGRFDVSRSMLASSRTALEELGLRHGLLETDLFTGMVELIAGDTAAAVAPLRAAYEGLGTLGVGADAGQAAALLATALLAQGEVDEAELMAAESEALAGQNLKTAIAWRTAKAQVLAARGDPDAAVALASEAVAIAAGTDLVLDHADACAVLADLRDATGDAVGARSARADALRLYEAKGATVPAGRTATAAVPATEPTPAVGVAGERTPACENAATGVVARLVSYMGTDVVPPEQLVSDALTLDDRRALVAFPGGGGDEIGGNFALMRVQGFDLGAPEPVAVRGERLALHRTRSRTDGGDESALLSIDQIDDDGRVCALVWFDDAAMDQALAELDARYLEGEGRSGTAVVRAGQRMRDLYRDRDWTAYRALLRDDVRFVDHRPLGFGSGGAEELIEVLRSGVDVTADVLQVARKLVHSERTALTVLRSAGTTADDGPVEWVRYGITQVDDAGRLRVVEWFAEDDWDLALARYDALVATPTGPANAATRVHAEVCDAINRRDYGAQRRLVARGYVQEDRRPVIGLGDQGRHGLTANHDLMLEQGYEILTPEPIATRGENLALSVVRARTPAGDESVLLAVNELAADGRFLRSTVFAESDAAAAFDELNDRYRALEGEGAVVLRVGAAMSGAYAERDWGAYRAVLSDAFRFVDHRRIGFGTADPDEFVETVRSTTGTVPEVETVRSVVTRDRAMLFVADGAGEIPDGGPVEWVRISILHVDAFDRIDAFEWFDEDDWSAALARLDELGGGVSADHRTPHAENAATRLLEQLRVALNDGDYETAGRMTADGYVFEDRRSVVAVPDVEALTADTQGASAQGFVILEPEVIAVRGARLCLRRLVYRTPGGDESPRLVLDEVDANDRLVRSVFFDDADLVTATAELDRAHYVGEGAPFQRVLGAIGRYAEAVDDHDMERARAALTPDFVMVDHQPLGFGTGDRDYYLSWSGSNRSGRGLTRALYVNDGALLSVNAQVVVSDEGSRYERGGCVVMGVDAAGRINRFEQFADEDFGAALARLDELGAETPADPRAPRVDNAAAAAMAYAIELCHERRFDEMRALLTDDFVREDRRHGVAAPTADGPDEFVRAYAAWFEVGFDALTMEPLAVRGEQLVLARLEWASGDGRKVGFLALYELAPDGRFVRGVHFDEDDLVAALEELDERYFAGEGGEHAAVGEQLAVSARVFKARDWDAYRELLADGFVAVSYFRFGFEFTASEYLDWLRALDEQMSALSIVPYRLAVVGRAVLASDVVTGVTPEGSEYRWRMHFLSVADAEGRLIRVEYFEDDQYEMAVARLHELGAATEPAVSNVASFSVSMVLRTASESFEEVDWVTGVAEDVVRVDKRRLVAAPPISDRAGYVANAAAFFDVFDTLDPEVVAVRGDRLALIRLHCGRAPDFVLRILALYELNGDWKLVFEADFDDNDLDAALDELDERFLAGEGTEHAFVVQRIDDFRHARASRDWGAVEALFAEDYVAVDRRPLGMGTGSRSGYLVASKAMVELVPDATFVPRSIDVDGDVVLIRTAGSGTSVDGSRSEWEQWVVWRFAAGRAVRGEVYGLEDEAAARARFAELAAQTLTPYIDNRVVRLSERARWRARHAGEAPDIYGADCVLDDRRSSVNAGLVSGGAAVAASIWSGVDVFGLLEAEAVAVRGERLALLRWAYVKDGGFEAPGLCVLEMGDDELVARITSFDEADLAAAIECLEARHLELRGDAITPQELTTAVGSRAFNDRDWDRLRTVYEPDVRFATHAPFTTEGGLDSYIEQVQVLAEQVAGVAVVFAKVTPTDRCGLSLLPLSGTTPEGSRYSWSMVQVTHMSDAGLIDRFELFDVEQWDEAVACYERWIEADASGGRADARTPDPENAATRVLLDAARLLWTDLDAALGYFAPDVVGFARESGPTAGASAEDPARWLDVLTSLVSTYDDVRFEPLAVRGERLALLRQEFVAHGFVTPALLVVELDEGGRVARLETFADDDLAGAAELLTDRDLTLRGSDLTLPERYLADAYAAWRRQDFDAFAETMEPAFVRTDRGPIGMGVEDRDAYVADMRLLATQVPGVVPCPAKVYASDRAVITIQHTRGTTREGSEFAWDVAYVIRVTPAGRAVEMVTFDEARWDEALALFDEWSAAPDEGTAVPMLLENAVTRIGAEVNGRLMTGDLEGARAFFADGFRYLDHRFAGVSPDADGFDAYLALFRSYVEVGFRGLDRVVLAVRGDRLSLTRFVTETRDGFAIAELRLGEVDRAGRLLRIDVYEPDDLVRALTELDRRYAATGDADATERQVLSAYGALNRREWDGFEARLAEELEVLDHRTLGFPPGDGGATLRRELQRLVEQVPDVLAYVTRIESSGVVALVTTHQTGTAAVGGDAEWEFVTVVRVDPATGRIDRIEYFDADAIGEARSRFDRLADEPLPPVTNRCVRVVQDGFRRHARGEDVSGTFGPIGDPAPGATLEPLAVRGDSLALARWRVGQESGLVVFEIDDSDCVIAAEAFDEGDFDVARADLDRRRDPAAD